MVTNFDKVFNQAQSSDKATELKDFYGVTTNEEVDRITRAYRDRVEIKKLNIDMSQVKYRKQGINEYKITNYANDAVKVPPIGTERFGSELLKDFEITTEIQAPVFYEDTFGNIWVRI